MHPHALTGAPTTKSARAIEERFFREQPVLSVEAGQASEPAQDVRSAAIELVIGAVTVRVPAGAEARDVVWRSNSWAAAC
jgi:hypothetical protein